MPIFLNHQPAELRIQRREVKADLLYENSRELAFRVAASEMAQEAPSVGALDQLREMLGPKSVRVVYRQGNYRCIFESRMNLLEADRSCPDGSYVLTLQLPARVRRILDLSSNLGNG
ncbi:MAG: hypothetical protein K1X75_14025 [Leptospirales bacterium]|nr:hypothetical protein [Leptospirales bacterium]